MVRYKCIISYDGHNYMGFQIQNELPTIELEIENAINKFIGYDVKIYPSGRTDRGVHARGQVIHFDLENEIPANGVKSGINAFLPNDIYIKECEIVDLDFHARFSAKSKEYRYYINKGEYDPLKINYSVYITNLDINRMREAIKLLEGKHDFKGFASASIDKRKDTIKEIYHTEINEIGDYLEFVFIGTGFLKYQVRRMMGALIEIGRGFKDKSLIEEILEKCDPKICHKVAPGCGLYLYKVNYKDE